MLSSFRLSTDAIRIAAGLIYVIGTPVWASTVEHFSSKRLYNSRQIETAVKGHTFRHNAMAEDGTSISSALVVFNIDGTFRSVGVHWPKTGNYIIANGQICFSGQGHLNGCYFAYSEVSGKSLTLIQFAKDVVVSRLTLNRMSETVR